MNNLNKQNAYLLIQDSYLQIPDSFLQPKAFRILKQKENIQRLESIILLKRTIDLVLVFILAPILTVLLTLIAILLYFMNNKQVVFKQQRIGYMGRSFCFYKFKTMIDTQDVDGDFLRHDRSRITKLGRYLRKHRLDELPQFFNVIKGDMTIIGPRPEISNAYDFFADYVPGYAKRKFVLPGITGLAQVETGHTTTCNGNIAKLKYDLKYIKNLSLFQDFIIVLKTFSVVCSGKGAQ